LSSRSLRPRRTLQSLAAALALTIAAGISAPRAVAQAPDSVNTQSAAPAGAAVSGTGQTASPGAAQAAAAADVPLSDPVAERGRYLATAGNCISCHTHQGGQPFAGGLAFATDFGTIYSSNITPDPGTGIGKWSEADFLGALRRGVRPNGEHLYPAFPYTSFTKLSDADAHALFVYLKTLTPVKSVPPANQMRFPYNQRWLLGVWNALFFKEGRFAEDKARPAQWNRGAYLVQALGHCDACHAPRNFMGAESSDPVMSGGEYTDAIPDGDLRTWSTPNLTSAASGLRSWPQQDLVDYLKTGRNSFAQTFGPMNEVIMNSTRKLSDADVQAIATYLKSLPASDSGSGAKASADVVQTGETVYNVNCGTCHLPTGLGSQEERSGARLAGSPVVQASNPASLINVILYGPQLSTNPPLPKRWKPMEGFADKLDDDEIAALASYLRSAWGNTGGAVTEAQVDKQE
jgi:mono/diheme cytochrome c family protein